MDLQTEVALRGRRRAGDNERTFRTVCGWHIRQDGPNAAGQVSRGCQLVNPSALPRAEQYLESLTASVRAKLQPRGAVGRIGGEHVLLIGRVAVSIVIHRHICLSSEVEIRPPRRHRSIWGEIL